MSKPFSEERTAKRRFWGEVEISFHTRCSAYSVRSYILRRFWGEVEISFHTRCSAYAVRSYSFQENQVGIFVRGGVLSYHTGDSVMGGGVVLSPYYGGP